MKFLSRFILQIIANIIAILLASHYIQGFIFQGEWRDLVIAGVVLGLINFFLKPILKIFFGPLIILTFGLFMILINMFSLWLVTLFVPSLVIQVGWPLLWGVIIISLVNLFFGLGTRVLKD